MVDPITDTSSTHLYEPEDKWWIQLQIPLQHISMNLKINGGSYCRYIFNISMNLKINGGSNCRYIFNIWQSEDKWWIQLQIPLQDISLNLKINGSSWRIWLNMLDLSRDKTSLKINSESNQRIQPENLPHYGKSNQRWNFTEDICLYFQGPLNILVTMETTL